jgi:iron complex outermembrane receptor protein
VAGLETRNSSIQTDTIVAGPGQDPRFFSTGMITVINQNGFLELDQRDVGVFTQLAYKPLDDLKIVAGGRVDNNDVKQTGGYGTAFNPRLAVIYTPGNFAFKSIYAEAFKDPSNAERFGDLPGLIEVRNADLESERVSSIELSAGWQPEKGGSVDMAIYEASYSNVVVLNRVPNTAGSEGVVLGETFRRENLGMLRARGVQLNASYAFRRFDFFGNYTYTDAVNTNPSSIDPSVTASSVRVGDIANHRVNLGVNVLLWNRLNANFRVNYVGDRKTGEGTTVSTNPNDVIDSYLVSHVVLTYEDAFRIFGNLRGSAQIIVNNVFDTDYYHPGVGAAGRLFAARLPQPGRSVFLRISLDF